MTPPDYASWLTKEQAAAAIDATTKTIERMAQRGEIQQARWRRPTGGPELAVYHPEDVARIAADRRPGPLPAFLVPVGAELPTNGNGHSSTALAIATPSPIIATLPDEDLFRALVTAAVKVMSETSQTSALFVTIPEAAALTGLTQAYLRRQIEGGTLKAVRDRGWKIRRKDLEAL